MDMDTSAENTRLVERVLRALKTKFSFVDSGMHDLPRLCRYCSSWNRKSVENSTERPWRVSSIVDAGGQTPVTVAQMDALCELVGVSKIEPVGDGVPRPLSQQKFTRRFSAYCDRIGVGIDAIRTLGNGDIYVQTEFCLWDESHTGSSCGVAVGVDGIRKNVCRHSGCAMPWSRWKAAVEALHGPMNLEGVINWKT
jgi:hypothetical protein